MKEINVEYKLYRLAFESFCMFGHVIPTTKKRVIGYSLCASG